AAGWREIRPVLRPAAVLAIPGTVITAVVSGLAASWVLGLSTLEGLLLGFIDWIQHPDFGLPDMAELFARQLGIGLVAGLAVGWLGVQAFMRARLYSPGLYPVASLATAALAFGAADTLDGSGFLAAYLAGLALGSADIPARRTV